MSYDSTQTNIMYYCFISNMSKKRYNVSELPGYSEYGDYKISPPCCGMELTHKISLSSIIKEGECWNCNTEIDVEIVLKS
jgi:hypothetical protein